MKYVTFFVGWQKLSISRKTNYIHKTKHLFLPSEFFLIRCTLKLTMVETKSKCNKLRPLYETFKYTKLWIPMKMPLFVFSHHNAKHVLEVTTLINYDRKINNGFLKNALTYDGIVLRETADETNCV